MTSVKMSMKGMEKKVNKEICNRTKSTDNKSVNVYLKAVRTFMKPIVSANKKFLCDLEQDIRDYEHSNPECTLQDLIDNFGEPELIAKQQIELMSEEDFLRISKKRKRYFVAVIILCIVCIALIGYVRHVLVDMQGTGELTLEVEDEGYIKETVPVDK